MRKPSPRRKQRPRAARPAAPKPAAAPKASGLSGIHPRMLKALNDQIGVELYSAHLYLAMSAWFSSQSLHGMARWMRLQSREEYAHGMKIYDHVDERGGRVILEEIAAPPTAWASPRAAFEDALGHERMVSDHIARLAELGRELRDTPATIFLQWFVSEQVEEEMQVQQILEQFDMIGASASMLFFLDRELGKRAAAAD